MKKKNDEGMGELLKLLKDHPELITALVFDPKTLKRLLKSEAARQLVLGVDTKAFLQAVAESGGGPIAICRQQTAIVRAKACAQGTTPCPMYTLTLAPCLGTKPCRTGTLPPCRTGTLPPPPPRTLPPRCLTRKR